MSVFCSAKRFSGVCLFFTILLASGCAQETGSESLRLVDAGSMDLRLPDVLADAHPVDVMDGSVEIVDVALSEQAFDMMGEASNDMGNDSPDANLETSALQVSQVYFAGTHNSYSGHERGSIVDQLGLGIRSLEFDFHDNDFDVFGDYRLGHTSPNSEVQFDGGNPTTSHLRAWLEVVRDWSDRNPGHAPIVLHLDAKDNLKDNPSPTMGNLGALNEMLRTVFGTKLWARENGLVTRTVESLRGHILVVLSGDRTTRTAYIVDEGVDPSVSRHQSGWVVAMHSDGGDRLWYWTGELNEPATQVRWLDHGRYDTGTQPTVSVLSATTVVEVHRSHTRDRLFGAIGRRQPSGWIEWDSEISLFDGHTPTLQRLGESSFRLYYRTGGVDGGYLEREGRLVNGALSFGAPQPASAPVPLKSNDGFIEVLSSGRNGYSNQTLLYRLVSNERLQFVRYEQLMFSEFQNGDSPFLASEATFAGFSSGSYAPVERLSGEYLTRLWSYDENDAQQTVQPHLLSTDEPFSEWFDAKMDALDALDW